MSELNVWWYGPDIFGRIPTKMHRWQETDSGLMTPACGVANEYGEPIGVSIGALISEDERPDIERCERCQ